MSAWWDKWRTQLDIWDIRNTYTKPYIWFRRKSYIITFLRAPYKISVRFNDAGKIKCSFVASGRWKVEAFLARALKKVMTCFDQRSTIATRRRGKENALRHAAHSQTLAIQTARNVAIHYARFIHENVAGAPSAFSTILFSDINGNDSEEIDTRTEFCWKRFIYICCTSLTNLKIILSIL